MVLVIFESISVNLPHIVCTLSYHSVIKMVRPKSQRVFLVMFIYYIYLATVISIPQNNYPSGSLACKTYEMTRMDCSNRNLLQVPVLDQNSTTWLDLSHNNLLNITNAPFEKLQGILVLNLSYNEISQMSSTSFRGLRSLGVLDLQDNKLTDLPKDIFVDLFHLLCLILNYNYFTAIPGYALASLYSLQAFSFHNFGAIPEIDFEGFQNMKSLDILILEISYLGKNISNDIFLPFEQLPIRNFKFFLRDPLGYSKYSVEADVFSPFNSITFLITQCEALPALTYLNSTLQLLHLNSCPACLDKTSFEVLQTQTSLRTLKIYYGSLRRIEDYTFTWTPNLFALVISHNLIHHLAKNAFYGLNMLRSLDLSYNAFSEVSSGSLEIFRNSTSLQYLDLSSNKITELISETSFSAVSTSLTYLSVGIGNAGGMEHRLHTKWLGSIRNLKHFSLMLSGFDFFPDVSMNSKQLSSLQTLTISNFYDLYFPTPICTLCPTLQFVALSTSAKVLLKARVLLMLKAFQGCSHLKELDLSGTLFDIRASDLKQLNITIV